MDMRKFVKRAVEIGIKGINATDLPDFKKKASIEGFKRCLTLGSLEQFEAALGECQEEQEKTRKSAERHKSGFDMYWYKRYITIQIEHVYGVLCFASHYNKWPGYQRLPKQYTHSARMGIAYAHIMKVS
jgi:hypothetical protein